MQPMDDRPDSRIADDGAAFQTLHELVRAARERLDEKSWDYLSAAARPRRRAPQTAWRWTASPFGPRILNDVSVVDPSTQFGEDKASLPVVLCPVGFARFLPPEGGRRCRRRRAPLAFLCSSVRRFPIRCTRSQARRRE